MLLVERMPLHGLTVQEAKGPAGRFVVRGVFGVAGKPTDNGRLYAASLWQREIGRLSEAIQARRAFGELDHPEDGRTQLQRVSHIITSLRLDGDKVIGEAEILDTPNGRILKELFRAGAQVGISSRGYGTTKPTAEGLEEVQDDYRLDTFDFVAEPAAKSAYPKLFIEERQHIEAAEKGLTVESLKRDYGGLLRLIAEEESARQVAAAREKLEGEAGERLRSAVERAAAKVGQEAERRLSEQFDRRLREAVEGLAQDAYRRAREDVLADPKVSGALAVLERVAELVVPFLADGVDAPALKADAAKSASELEALSTRIKELEETAEKLAASAKSAGYALHLERRVGAHPARDAVLRLVGDVSQYYSLSDLDAKLDEVFEELGAPVPAERVHEELREYRERLEELEAGLDEAMEAHRKADEAIKLAEERAAARVRAVESERDEIKSKLESAETQAKSMKARIAELEKALESSESSREELARRVEKLEEDLEAARVRLHVERRVSGRPDADRLRRMTGPARSVREAEELLEEAEAAPVLAEQLPDGDVARIRARVSRGLDHEPGDGVVERRSRGIVPRNGSNPLEDFGLRVDDFDLLAGVKTGGS